MTFTLLDGILIGIMLVSAILAMIRGFSREVLSVVSWIVAAIAAFYLYPSLTPYAAEYIPNETIAMGVAALAIFFIALIVVSLITMRIADFIIDSRIGALDRTLGFVFGAVRGLLLVVVAILFFNWLAPENQPQWIAEAESKEWLDGLGAQLVAVLPENPEETILEQFGTEEAEEASPPSGAEGIVEPETNTTQ